MGVSRCTAEERAESKDCRRETQQDGEYSVEEQRRRRQQHWVLRDGPGIAQVARHERVTTRPAKAPMRPQRSLALGAAGTIAAMQEVEAMATEGLDARMMAAEELRWQTAAKAGGNRFRLPSWNVAHDAVAAAGTMRRRRWAR